jgi:predicted RNA binding protein YcfA (HicA-like mRNA interferase family)
VEWASRPATPASVPAFFRTDAGALVRLRWRTTGLMPMKVREVIRLLEKHGWIEMRSRGSHRHFKHPNQPLVVTVPGNEGKELAPGTLNAILKKAGLK